MPIGRSEHGRTRAVGWAGRTRRLGSRSEGQERRSIRQRRRLWRLHGWVVSLVCGGSETAESTFVVEDIAIQLTELRQLCLCLLDEFLG